MVLTTDSGMKARCANRRCRNPIIHREQVGVVDDGRNLWHADCFRDRFGNESVRDRKWLRESRLTPLQRIAGARRVT